MKKLFIFCASLMMIYKLNAAEIPARVENTPELRTEMIGAGMISDAQTYFLEEMTHKRESR